MYIPGPSHWHEHLSYSLSGATLQVRQCLPDILILGYSMVKPRLAPPACVNPGIKGIALQRMLLVISYTRENQEDHGLSTLRDRTIKGCLLLCGKGEPRCSQNLLYSIGNSSLYVYSFLQIYGIMTDAEGYDNNLKMPQFREG